ncbi:pyrimidine dimer DNA glycosylase /DNA-(apurinic or apyrimidinic site) lyase [Tersicoccus solisilvae]|uniref:Pyrimidine dimer DNA glycosylase /DNA-(Apurinic or apyrimidinic site) lyase n=1 Tax=Tersicoccus solisilvae TaxID=1882339 RepID=A0ABQ1NTQ8_9MICC|nr:pyrimidine dimer DNA glycosylase /DNA-(apurinic or apyrimidinic site) lyase [Tersicoccus solisilvae]
MWSLHPSLLDRRGLVACWRESLLAQKVLRGQTKGYRNHPQLTRFRRMVDPVASVGAYLAGLAEEADARGFTFNRALIEVPPSAAMPPARMTVTSGQLDHEWTHLLAKTVARDTAWHERLTSVEHRPHPLFDVVPGPVEEWEIIGD